LFDAATEILSILENFLEDESKQFYEEMLEGLESIKRRVRVYKPKKRTFNSLAD